MESRCGLQWYRDFSVGTLVGGKCSLWQYIGSRHIVTLRIYQEMFSHPAFEVILEPLNRACVAEQYSLYKSMILFNSCNKTGHKLNLQDTTIIISIHGIRPLLHLLLLLLLLLKKQLLLLLLLLSSCLCTTSLNLHLELIQSFWRHVLHLLSTQTESRTIRSSLQALTQNRRGLIRNSGTDVW